MSGGSSVSLNPNRCLEWPACASWKVIVVVVLLVISLGRSAEAETWAEKLGYPADKRVVILYASQLGMCYESNHAGTKLLEAGMIQSASAMVPCPWFGDLAQWASQHPDLDVGISLTMTSVGKHYRWRPISPRADVPGLVDADGYLCGSVAQFTFNATPEQVEKEIEAQIQKARAAGLRPTHLAPHLGALFSRPDTLAVYLKTARKHWIPALVIELTPEHVQRFRERGLPLDEQTLSLVRNYPLPKIDDLRFTPNGETYEKKRDAFFKMIAGLSPGITQVVTLPAIESEGLRRITDDHRQRVFDARLLADPEVHAFLKKEDLQFTSWREIMMRFEGKMPLKGKQPVDGGQQPDAKADAKSDAVQPDVTSPAPEPVR